MKLPELVLPAGNLEKLKIAILFGADAVYLGGKDFSLRAYAGNLSLDEMSEGIDFAHERMKKTYIGVNIFAHNQDLRKIPDFLEKLKELQVDGLIISDPGILRLAKKYAPGIPVTISTQANTSNYEAAAFYRDLGAQRIVLARELTLDEMEEIKRKVEIELEVFIHGAMCVSYSGRCLLSHYMTGRSANSGACAHPCRYRYALMEEKRPGEYYSIEEDERGSYILNSCDLCLLEYIPRLMDMEIEAFKVEGRMKSPLYVASTASIYRKAIDCYYIKKESYNTLELDNWLKELESTATRPFTNGFIDGESALLQDINKAGLQARADFCGIVRAYRRETGMLEIEQRANFGPGDNLEFYLPGGEIIKLDVDTIYDQELNLLDRARHPQQRVLLPGPEIVPQYSILRRIGAQDED
jgi:putative protease